MNKLHPPRCLECGAEIPEGGSCQDYLNQMLAWEFEDPEHRYGVHNLMVLSFYLQHPSRYSPEGLKHAQGLLVDFLVRGITTEEIRRHNRDAVNSTNRKWKVTGTAQSFGVYDSPPQWTMTAADVIGSGMDQYVESVTAWARSILNALEASGNLPHEAN